MIERDGVIVLELAGMCSGEHALSVVTRTGVELRDRVFVARSDAIVAQRIA